MCSVSNNLLCDDKAGVVSYHTCTYLQHIRVNVLSRKEKAQFLGILICAQSGFIQGCIFLCVSLGWPGRGSLLRLVKRLYRCLPFNFLCRIIGGPDFLSGDEYFSGKYLSDVKLYVIVLAILIQWK